MNEQHALNQTPSSSDDQPLEVSQTGELSNPQMLDQMLHQLLAQLPEALTQPEAMAGMASQMLGEQSPNQAVPETQTPPVGQSPKPRSVQPQPFASEQSPEQQSSGMQSQLSQMQGLSQMIEPIMSQTQSLMSGLGNLDLFGTGVEQLLSSGSTPNQSTNQSAPDIQKETLTSVPSMPVSQVDTSSSALMPDISAAEEHSLSPTQASEAASKGVTEPSSVTNEANQQGHQVSSQSIESSSSMMTGLGDPSLSEFLPDPAKLQHLFEQSMGMIPQFGSDLRVSPKSASDPMEAVTEATVAVPLTPKISPDFYFLPNSKPEESTSAVTPQDEQTAQLPQDGFNVEAVRQDFPILHQQINGKPLIWMDNAATTQKPQMVIDTLSQFYEQDNSNVHRGAHTLAARATNAYEDARQKIQRFLGASLAEEIVFVRGTTEGINLVAQSYGRQHVKAGDEILLTTLEHHANIVPWQMLAQEKGAVLKVAPISDSGEVLLEEYEKLLSDRTRIVALSHVSNVLGTVLPIKAMVAMAHRHGATVVVDGAQSVPHFRTNVQDLGADFYVFSGHKLFGPTGIGALYGKASLLRAMPPWQSGGNMIESVSFEKTTFNDIPAKFEAGTGNLAAAVGLGAAIDYLNQIGFEAAAKHEEALMAYGTMALAAIPGLRQIGTALGKVSVLSFTLKNISPEEMGKFLNRQGIAVRAGHHCAQPTMKRFGVTSTVRPSLSFYNTFEEVDELITAIKKAQHQLS